MNISLEGIIEEVKVQRDYNLENFIQDVATSVAYDILFQTKYQITHDFDPPYDCSGKLITIEGQDRFYVKNYNMLGDFFEEYTGNTTATYWSGCGLSHDTYEKEYEELIRDYIYNSLLPKAVSELCHCDKEEFCKLLKNNDVNIDDIEQTPENLSGEIIFSDIIGDELLGIEDEIIEVIRNMDISFLYKKGKLLAMEIQREEEIKHQESREIAEKELQESKKIWGKLPILYKLRFGTELPAKIDKSNYSKFKIFFEEFDPSEKSLIIKYQSCLFSSSVLKDLA